MKDSFTTIIIINIGFRALIQYPWERTKLSFFPLTEPAIYESVKILVVGCGIIFSTKTQMV